MEEGEPFSPKVQFVVVIQPSNPPAPIVTLNSVIPESESAVFRYLTSPPPPPPPLLLNPPPPPPPTTRASAIEVTPAGTVNVCPLRKVIMHLPETELSTVTTEALVLAKPVLQELQVGVAYAGKDCPTSKMLTMATRSFLTWGFYPLIVTIRFRGLIRAKGSGKSLINLYFQSNSARDALTSMHDLS